MSLRTRYKTDSKAAAEGTWIEYEANTDGTIPRFKLARVSKQNKRYQAAFRDATKPYTGDNGLIDFSAIPAEAAEKLLLNVFVDTVLIDWENFQPEDDGNNVEYSPEQALAILGSDDWADFYEELNTAAHKAANFRQKAVKAQAKN